MNVLEIKESLKTDSYNFLRNNMFLGDNIILLGLGGSYAYGTNNEGSDVDVRGIATNSRKYILSGRDFDNVIERETDTTIYSFDKMVDLLCRCNANTIELLGLKPDHYLYLTPAGQMILDNKDIFITRIAEYSFCGYADRLLRKLQNNIPGGITQEEEEQNILRSINHASCEFRTRYSDFGDDAIKLYMDKATDESDMNQEIFMDVVLHHYPLRDYKGMWHEMHAIVKSYEGIGQRNKKAIEHDKLGKHMSHLIRLYYMGLDILENGVVRTYREGEHDLLMSIRNNGFLDSNGNPISAFFDLVNELRNRFDYAKEHTELPKKPDITRVYELKAAVNAIACER